MTVTIPFIYIGGTSKERSLGDPPVDYLRKPIEYGNPAQKLLFLRNLGLVPKEGELHQ